MAASDAGRRHGASSGNPPASAAASVMGLAATAPACRRRSGGSAHVPAGHDSACLPDLLWLHSQAEAR
jgi:hypothetical protein